MLNLHPNFLTDDDNNKVAVQLSIKSYNKIKEVLENYGLYKLMEEDTDDKPLELNEAKAYYKKLKKKK